MASIRRATQLLRAAPRIYFQQSAAIVRRGSTIQRSSFPATASRSQLLRRPAIRTYSQAPRDSKIWSFEDIQKVSQEAKPSVTIVGNKQPSPFHPIPRPFPLFAHGLIDTSSPHVARRPRARRAPTDGPHPARRQHPHQLGARQLPHLRRGIRGPVRVPAPRQGRRGDLLLQGRCAQPGRRRNRTGCRVDQGRRVSRQLVGVVREERKGGEVER